MGIERNIKESFRNVKIEIISLKDQILKIAEAQNELKHIVTGIQADLKKKTGKKSINLIIKALW